MNLHIGGSGPSVGEPGDGCSRCEAGATVARMVIYVDESKQRDFVMVAAVVLGNDLSAARAVVQDPLPPGQHYLHMKNEADVRKETIAKSLVAADLQATVYDAGRRHR